MASEEMPSTSSGRSSSSASSSGIGEEFVMIEMTPFSSSRPGASESNPDMPDTRVVSRRHSCSSIASSTDSCLSEAKFASVHGLEFDFLLWFCQENEKEADLIFEVLEKQKLLRGYRNDRDETAGRYKISNVSEAIKRCWKILLLVSPEALADNWFSNQMHQSLTHDINESKGHVIPILLKVERKDLPTYLSSIYSLLYPPFPETDNSSESKHSSLHQESPSCETEQGRFLQSLISIFACQDDRKRHQSTSSSISKSPEPPSASHKTKGKSKSESKQSWKPNFRKRPIAKLFSK